LESSTEEKHKSLLQMTTACIKDINYIKDTQYEMEIGLHNIVGCVQDAMQKFALMHQQPQNEGTRDTLSSPDAMFMIMEKLTKKLNDGTNRVSQKKTETQSLEVEEI